MIERFRCARCGGDKKRSYIDPCDHCGKMVCEECMDSFSPTICKICNPPLEPWQKHRARETYSLGSERHYRKRSWIARLLWGSDPYA